MERAELNITLTDTPPSPGTGGTAPGTGGDAVLAEMGKIRELLERKGSGGAFGEAGVAGGSATGGGIGSFFEELGALAQRSGLPALGGVVRQTAKLFGPGKATIPVATTTEATAAEAAGLPEVAAAGGGGAAGMLGAAAGPLMLAEAVSRVVAGAFNTASAAIREVADVAQHLASNDALGGLLGAAEGAAKGLEQIPIVGQVYAAEIRLVTTAISSFRDTVNAFVERGRQLAPYSADLTSAGVTADVREMISDIREANTIGPDLARLTDAQSRAWAEAREIILPIKKMIVENLTEWMELIARKLEENRAGALATIEMTRQLLDILLKFASMDVQGGVQGLKDLPEKIRKAIEDALKPKDELNELFDQQLKDIAAGIGAAANAPGPRFDPIKAAGQQGLGLPLL